MRNITGNPPKPPQDTSPLMTTGQMIDSIKQTAETIVRDLNHRRSSLRGKDIDDLDKAYKLLVQIKKHEQEANKGDTMQALLERALKHPELRDALKRTLDNPAPAPLPNEPYDQDE